MQGRKVRVDPHEERVGQVQALLGAGGSLSVAEAGW